MTQGEWIGIVTRFGIIICYAVALVVSVRAHLCTDNTARKISSITIAIVCIGWLFFYLLLVDYQPHELTPIALWSRLFQYLTGIGLWMMAYMILMADRSVEKATNGHG